MEIKKSTAEVYKIKTKNTWANISIENLGKKGFISIQSGYGEWNNYWGSCGGDFNEFLCRLDIGYFAGKIGESNFFYLQETKEHFSSEFKRALDQEEITKEDYNSLMEELKGLNNNFFGCDKILEYYHYSPDCIYGVSPQFRNFWSEIWQPFTDYLSKIEPLKNETTKAIQK